MFRKETGQITVFSVIALPGLLLFLLLLIDFTKIKLSENHLESLLYRSADGVLSQYDKDLWIDYQLMGLDSLGEYTNEISCYFDKSFFDRDTELISWNIELLTPLERDALKKQILEASKVEGWLTIGHTVIDKLKSFQTFNKQVKELEKFDLSKNMASGVEERIDENLKRIEGLEALQKEGQPVEQQIELLYEENRELLILKEDLKDSNNSEHMKGPDLNRNYREDLRRLERRNLGDQNLLEECFKSPDKAFWSEKETLDTIDKYVESGLEGMRNELLINEYILKYFESLKGGGDGSVENILYGEQGQIKGVLSLFLTRFLIDGVGYFSLDPKAPPEATSRLVYALIGGLLSGIKDTADLLDGNDNTVSLVTIEPKGANVWSQIQLSYEDHLRIFLLMESEDEKIFRVHKQLSENKRKDWYTGISVEATINQSLFLLGKLPENSKLFNGRIKGGQYEVTKKIEKYY